jgi:non-canonical (house-cleaning) NTP pyrophosphatase
MKQIRVAVGTKNPCKIDAVKEAFRATFPPHCEIIIFPFQLRRVARINLLVIQKQNKAP